MKDFKLNKKLAGFALLLCLNIFAVIPYADAQSNNRPDALTYYKRAIEYLFYEDYDKAIADFNYVLRVNPESADAYAMRARAYYEKGDYDRAIADCNLAIKYNRNNASAFSIRGSSYGKKGDFDKAIKDWEAALRVDKNYDNARLNIEKARQQRGY